MTIHLPKVNEFGGGNGGGGGSSSFPIIVTSSGSSLPSASGYQVGDTFLNTSDKKIYKAEEGIVDYTLATGITSNNWQSSNVSVDLDTGVASNFLSGSGYNYFYKTNVNKRWNGVQEYNVHFKITANPSSSTLYNIFVLNNQTDSSHSKNVAVGIKDNKLQIQCFSSYSSMGSGSYSQIVAPKEILDFTLEQNVEYFLTIKKKDSAGTIETSISTTNYTENILATQTTETGIEDVSTSYSSSCLFFYGQLYKYNSSFDTTLYNYGYSFTIGQVYLGDSSGDFVTANIGLSWDSGTSITDKTEYADKTNGILYLYQDTELTQIPLIDLSNYKLKATTTIIDTASVTVSEIKANTNYVFSNNAITDITLSGCETSFEETSIEFTLPADISNFSFTDNSGITWVDGSPTFNASKSYLIVIFNKLGFVKEY